MKSMTQQVERKAISKESEHFQSVSQPLDKLEIT
jgi:hypothetical protein